MIRQERVFLLRAQCRSAEHNCPQSWVTCWLPSWPCLIKGTRLENCSGPLSPTSSDSETLGGCYQLNHRKLFFPKYFTNYFFFKYFWQFPIQLQNCGNWEIPEDRNEQGISCSANPPTCTSYLPEIALLRDLRDYNQVMCKSGRQTPICWVRNG